MTDGVRGDLGRQQLRHFNDLAVSSPLVRDLADEASGGARTVRFRLQRHADHRAPATHSRGNPTWHPSGALDTPCGGLQRDLPWVRRSLHLVVCRMSVRHVS